ncbi:MAG: hypothetical protein Q9159_000753 [Coniocarpon cinnabarinum]
MSKPKRRVPDPSQERPPRGASKKHKKTPERSQGSHDEVLAHDLNDVLASLRLSDTSSASAPDSESSPHLPLLDEEITLTITTLSSTGAGIAIHDQRPYVVPFAYPGDTLTARITRHTAATTTSPAYSSAFPIAITTPSPDRDDTLVKCKYFGLCSGCQFQPLPYSKQLEHKRRIIGRAYRNFSTLTAHEVPSVAETIGSPLQYGYRTKLTPHFDAPPTSRRARRHGEKVHWETVPDIGFNRADGSRRVLDVEECPIGTETVQKGLVRERKRVVRELDRYQRGATVLLRETARRIPRADLKDQSQKRASESKEQAGSETKDPSTTLHDPGPESDHVIEKQCISDHHAYTTEYVGSTIFKNNANAFFQNNNAILPRFVDYIRDHVLAPPSPYPSSTSHLNEHTASTATKPTATRPKITNLIDAYCGSGLFSLTLVPLFQNTLGIDISSESIRAATENRRLNGLSPSSPSHNPASTQRGQSYPATAKSSTTTSSAIETAASAGAQTATSSPAASTDARTARSTTSSTAPPSSAPNDPNHPNITFTTGDASSLFASADYKIFTPDTTAVIIDPPRKGCDEGFLTQLFQFGPARIVSDGHGHEEQREGNEEPKCEDVDKKRTGPRQPT